MVAIEVAGAHGEFRGHQLVADLQRCSGPASQVHLPAGRAQAPDRAGPASAEHLQALQMAHVVANQVGARGPGGQAQAQLGPGGLQLHRDGQQVALGIAQIEANGGHAWTQERCRGWARAPSKPLLPAAARVTWAPAKALPAASRRAWSRA